MVKDSSNIVVNRARNTWVGPYTTDTRYHKVWLPSQHEWIHCYMYICKVCTYILPSGPLPKTHWDPQDLP